MNKIPNPTLILGTPYKVKYVKELKDDCDRFLLGQIDFAKGEIYIINKVNKVLKEKTWMHEVVHGICQDINIRMTENETDTFANTLYDVLTRNKVSFIDK